VIRHAPPAGRLAAIALALTVAARDAGRRPARPPGAVPPGPDRAAARRHPERRRRARAGGLRVRERSERDLEPAGAHIARLERLLPPSVRAQPAAGDVALHEYSRQYAGFVVNRRRHICVWLFHFAHVHDTLDRAARDPALLARLGADGRLEDFVEFDVEAGSFGRLHFNSPR
jgi:hypothetical protein